MSDVFAYNFVSIIVLSCTAGSQSRDWTAFNSCGLLRGTWSKVDLIRASGSTSYVLPRPRSVHHWYNTQSLQDVISFSLV